MTEPRSGKTTRRVLLKRAGALGAGIAGAGLVAACGPAAAPGAANLTPAPTTTPAASPTPWRGTGQVVYGGAGGTFQDAVRKTIFEPFTQETGVKVIDVGTYSLAKLVTQVETGNVEWDVVDVGADTIGQAVTKNLLERVDYTIVNAEGLPAASKGQYVVGWTQFSTFLIYSTRKIKAPNVPQSWADFWDQTKFPGTRAMWKNVAYTLEIALMADGVAIDKLYPLDVERAFKKLDAIKPHVKVWWTSGAQPIQLVRDGEVEMSNAWNARTLAAKKEGGQLDYTWNQGILAGTWEGVPRGTKNKENAMHLLAYMTDPKSVARLANEVKTSPANQKAYANIDPAILPDLAAAPQNASKQAVLDEADFWAKNREALIKRFDEWLAK